jgi:predicted  nucleic acid-binding Zn-ribbon protein
MSQIDHLYRLQLLDDDIRQSKERLSDVLRLQAESSELFAARERVEVAKAELQQRRTSQNDLDLELSSLNTKSKRSEDRLYSGTVKNPKELADIQQEIESLGRRRAVLEDEVLEAMIFSEDAEVADETATTELIEIEETWQHDQEDLQLEQAELVQRLGKLLATRKQQLVSISPQALKAYEGAKRHAGPTAVVLLINGRCRGCQVTVPAMLAKSVNEGQMATCDSCGRLLYLG